jgi:hypothetical protein
MRALEGKVINYEPFLFMPGHTIEAVIRSKNNYVHGQTLQELVDLFNEKNQTRTPKAGENFQIPVIVE